MVAASTHHGPRVAWTFSMQTYAALRTVLSCMFTSACGHVPADHDYSLSVSKWFCICVRHAVSTISASVGAAVTAVVPHTLKVMQQNMFPRSVASAMPAQ